MADKLRLGNEVRELKIGQSFTNNKSGAFHAVRYDFKPASVDINKIATVDIGNSNQVTVNVPHLDGAGVPATVFKGSHRPFTKECVLIIDRVTGEITLEKLSSNIQLKKTRSEKTVPQLPQERAERPPPSSNASAAPSVLTSAPRPQTPPMAACSVGQRQSNKTRVTSGSRRLGDRQIQQLPNAPAKHSPLRASPNYASPTPHKSPKRDRTSANGEASLPMIGIDDFAEDPPAAAIHEPPPTPSLAAAAAHSMPLSMDSWHKNSSAPKPAAQPLLPPPPPAAAKARLSSQSDSEDGSVHDMSDSSSSSSSSDSDSDHDDDKKRGANGHAHHHAAAAASTASGMMSHNGGVAHPAVGGANNGGGANNSVAKLGSLPAMLLNDDLQLSESGSDFDDDD